MIARDKHLLVCVGPGGVGKTTLSAALAVRAAREGRKVALLTIDPAKRLADALGLAGLGDALVPVRGAPGLEAAMLDTKASFDALIGRVAPDPDRYARILENQVYQSFSRTLARPHAYVAMERLYDVTSRGEHDLVILDTPPTRSALDVLDAPGRLVRFLDERVLDAFLGGEKGGAKAWLRARGASMAIGLLSRLVGRALVSELATFFEIFLDLRKGFVERASRTQEILRAPATAFALVTAPEPLHLADAGSLAAGLAERGVPLDALLFNRAFHPSAGAAEGYDPAALAKDEDERRILAAARALRAHARSQDLRRAEAARAFAATHRALSVWELPDAGDAPTDVDALDALVGAARPA
ncbi:MAG: ArsA family ATPase [Sandaracinaceae bacterium]|nr:ArsA family ATPase [Sandaracinaceae bacterium]